MSSFSTAFSPTTATGRDPVRVLLLIDRLGRGGAAQVVVNAALALNRDIFSPIVCVTRQKETYGQDELLRKAGIPLLELNRQSRWRMDSWAPLRKILPTVTILHAHQTGSNFWGRLWGTLHRIPIIITQDHTAADEKHQIEHLVDRLMSPLSDRIVAVSRYDRELSVKLEKLPPDKTVTIYNGIDVERFNQSLGKIEARRRAGLPENKRLIAILARLAAQKNHHTLFEALTLLPSSLRESSHCLLVGTGELEQTLRREVTALGLDEMVSFLGERGDVPILLQALDVLVLPSHWECLPVVILEALAAGCPVVATAVGGVPEVLEEVGWPLIRPRDAQALANAIADVLQMPEAKQRHIIDAGKRRVQQTFSREASVDRLEDLYRILLHEKAVKGVKG